MSFTSNPDILQGCRGYLVMQKLQTLKNAVEFDEGSLVQALDIELAYARVPLAPVRPEGHHANRCTSRRCRSGHLPLSDTATKSAPPTF